MIAVLRARLLLLWYERWFWVRMLFIGLGLGAALLMGVDVMPRFEPAPDGAGIFLLLAVGGALPALLEPVPLGTDGDTRPRLALPALPATPGQRALSTVLLAYAVLVPTHFVGALWAAAARQDAGRIEALPLLAAQLPLVALAAT
jgi:hypothetical protein